MNGITLYHGSKAVIEGRIAPISRSRCDFGKGFYMGTDAAQPLTLICNYPDACLYTLKADLSGLKVLEIGTNLDWALLVAYHRGRMESAKGTPLYQRISELSEGCDIIVGAIANDRMFVVLDRFFSGEITEQALIHSLSALQLGRQYTARTQKACDQIEIREEHRLSGMDREELKRRSEANRAEGIALADEICRRYRREGRYFDEILAEGEG